MPKIKPEDNFDDDDEEDEDEEEEELEYKPRKANMPGAGRPRKIKAQPQQPKRRFGITAPQLMKIVDTETNEVIGEGEYAIIQALTDILERLERIEVQIGAVINN